MANAEQNVIGMRDFLREVNLRDFLDMVRSELGLVGTSVGLAIESRTPVLPLVLLVALVRLALLAAVIVVFGAAIAAISTVRAVARRLGRAPVRRDT